MPTTQKPGSTSGHESVARAMIEEIILRRLRLPLHRPFRTSYATFHEFEPMLVEARLSDGAIGWGEGHVVPGSSRETREEGWASALGWAKAVVGTSTEEACRLVMAERRSSPGAATAVVTAIEMALRHPLLVSDEPLRIPLLIPLGASEPEAIAADVDRHLAAGFRTLKIKVGPDPDESLTRIRHIQRATQGRVSLRLDANRSFTRAEALSFVAKLDPQDIELFEQPCGADAWDDNAATAAVSPVPLMLDESISSTEDIARAAEISGVGFCKLKLKRFGSLDALRTALDLVRASGMQAVLGDGLSSDLGCWMEARAGVGLICGAGEFNGFLKPRLSLMGPKLKCEAGDLVVPSHHWPSFEPDRLRSSLLEQRAIAP